MPEIGIEESVATAINCVVTIQLVILTLIFIGNFRSQDNTKFTKFLVSCSLFWITNLVYLLTDYILKSSNNPVHLFTSSLISTSGCLILIFGYKDIITLSKSLASNKIQSYLIHLCLIFFISTIISFFVSGASKWLSIPIIFIHIVAIFMMANGWRMIMETKNDSSHNRIVVYPLYLYSLLQILFIIVVFGPSNYRAFFATIGFIFGFALKLAHGYGISVTIFSLSSSIISFDMKTRIISEMAHELMTPAADLQLNAEILEEDYRKKIFNRSRIKTIIGQANTITAIVHATEYIVKNDYTHKPDPRDEKFSVENINALCHQAILQVKNVYPNHHVYISTDYSSRASALVQPYAFVQVITNIIKNAYESIGENKLGDIIVKTSNTISADIRTVEVSISDDGPGIRKEIVDRIWERGVTYKEGGRGIGLSLAKEYILNMNGHIDIYSPPKNIPSGSEFVIKLPYEAK